MRRLKGAEVAVLVTGLVIGHGNADADEQQTWGGTVVVTGTRITTNTVQMFQFPAGTLGTGVIPTGQGVNTSGASAQQKHAIDCALAYAGGPKAGWITYFDNNYGWSRGVNVFLQTTSSAPPPYPDSWPNDTSTPNDDWQVTKGLTVGTHPGYPYILGQTNIFLKSHTSTKDLITTIVHEWYHQFLNGYGHNPPNDEASAEKYGKDAADRYQADNGSKCGGL